MGREEGWGWKWGEEVSALVSLTRSHEQRGVKHMPMSMGDTQWFKHFSTVTPSSVLPDS